MARNPDFEAARKELERLKQREKELEARLGIQKDTKTDLVGFKQSWTPQQNEEVSKNGIKVKDAHDKNMNTISSKTNGYDNLAQSVHEKPISQTFYEDSIGEVRRSRKSAKNEEAKQFIPKSEIPQIIYEEYEQDKEEIKQKETDEYDEMGDSLEELHLSDSSMEWTIFNGGENFNDDFYEEELRKSLEDKENIKRNSPIDHRDDIFRDIAESKQRERALKFERGSIENLDEYETSESDDEEETEIYEDSRTKIMREIEQEKIRELEYKAKYQLIGIELTDHHDEFEKSTLSETVDQRDLIAFEIEEFEKREEELRLNRGALPIQEYKREEVNSVNSHVYPDTRGRIETELLVQQLREEELTNIHRILSCENLVTLDNKEPADPDVDENEMLDTRGKILTEMEELRIREKELKERVTQTYWDEDNQVNDKDVSIAKTREEREKYNGASQRINEEATSNMSLKDTKINMFGSREELLAFYGSVSDSEELQPKTTTPRINPVQIPSLFLSLQKNIPSKNEIRSGKTRSVISPRSIGFSDNEYSPTSSDVRHMPEPRQETRNGNRSGKARSITPSRNTGLSANETSPTSSDERYMPESLQDTMPPRNENIVPSGDITTIEPMDPNKTSPNELPNNNYIVNMTDDFRSINHEDNDAPLREDKDARLHEDKDARLREDNDARLHEDNDPVPETYFHDEMKPMKASKKKMVLRKKSITSTKGLTTHDTSTKSLTTHDVKIEEKHTNRKVALNTYITLPNKCMLLPYKYMALPYKYMKLPSKCMVLPYNTYMTLSI